MEIKNALSSFSALSQETRLNVLRLLIQNGPDGLAAGEIATQLGVRQNTLSTNLNILNGAGLVRSEREGRSIRYFADMDGLKSVMAFLMQDCCGGRPETCQPVLDELVCCK